MIIETANYTERGKMKSKTIVLCALIMMASFAWAADFKVGYINSERLRKDFNDFIDAQAQFDKEVSVWENEAREFEQEIIDLQSELEQQALLLSEDKKLERKMVIEQKQKEYQQYLAKIFGTNGLAEQRNSELTSPLLDKINQALIDMAESEGYDLILDVSGGNVAYIDENLDITDRLIEDLDSEISD